MKRTSLFFAVMTLGGLAACKTATSGSDVREGGDAGNSANTALYDEIRVALEDAGCDGCHGEMNNEDYNQWADDTKLTFERLTSEEPPEAERGPNSSFNIATFTPKGVYKAYPEYFRIYFADDAGWKEFAKANRPPNTPGMKVRGAGDVQKQRFVKVRDLMLKLSAQLGTQTSLGCTTKVSDPLKAHLQEMAASGWGPKLLTGDIKMFGCPAGTVDATQCLADTAKWKDRPDLLNQDVGVAGTRMVQVAAIGSTSYWMRSSPDGRFVGNGGPARIDDLQTKTRFLISTKSYDPGFFPDNSGWTFHGSGVVFCSNSTLKADAQTDPSTTTVNGETWKQVTLNPTSTQNKPYCLGSSSSSSISTYQSVATGQGSTSYVVTGSHSTDPGSVRQDSVSFPGNMNVYELKSANGTYDYNAAVPTKVFKLPNEGDYSLTPTGTYVVGRVAGEASAGSGQSVQLGIRLRSLQNMLQQGDTFNPANDPTMSSICVRGSGSKPMVSLDERFVTYHVYANNKADVWVFDLANGGKGYQVTNVPSGFRALFPHFLANNMLYFQLQPVTGERMVIATDIAARLPLTPTAQEMPTTPPAEMPTTTPAEMPTTPPPTTPPVTPPTPPAETGPG